jgi:hypothetical protein
MVIRQWVARIVGIPPQTDERLRRLMATGILSWNGSKPRFAPAQTLAPADKKMRLILADIVLSFCGYSSIPEKFHGASHCSQH